MGEWRYKKYMKPTLSQRKQDAICNFLGYFQSLKFTCYLKMKMLSLSGALNVCLKYTT